MNKPFYTTNEAALLLNVTRSAMIKAADRNRIEYIRVGVSNLRLFTPEAIEVYRHKYARKADKK